MVYIIISISSIVVPIFYKLITEYFKTKRIKILKEIDVAKIEAIGNYEKKSKYKDSSWRNPLKPKNED